MFQLHGIPLTFSTSQYYQEILELFIMSHMSEKKHTMIWGRAIYLPKVMLTPTPHSHLKKKKKKIELPHGLSYSVPDRVFQSTDTNHTNGWDMSIFVAR